MADWTETLVNREVHSPIATWTMPTLITMAAAAFLGYAVLRYIPLRKLPPLLCILAMAAMYLGAGFVYFFAFRCAGMSFCWRSIRLICS